MELAREVGELSVRFDSLDEKLDVVGAKLDKIADTLPAHDKRLMILEAAADRRAKMWARVGKVVAPVLVAIIVFLVLP